MKINRLRNDSGEFRCFEVDNTIISRHGMAQVISKIDGVRVTHYPKFHDDETFCEFLFRGKQFCIYEPFGDSSTYDLVGPEGSESEMNTIADHFENSAPIKGGDLGHNIYFLITWSIGSFFIMGILYGLYRGFKWVFS